MACKIKVATAVFVDLLDSCKSRKPARRTCWKATLSHYHMAVKTIGIFGVVVIASIALLQPAQGRSHGSGHSFSPAHHYSASAGHFSSHPRNFSGSTPRFYRSSPRFSSQAAFRNRAYSATGPRLAINRATALNPTAYSAAGPRLAVNRTTALSSQGFTRSGRVLAASSRNWDRSRDHFWHGHRCHWHNNAWVIFDLGFYPWDYGWGYPYGAYSYYDSGYYGEGYAPDEYSQGPDSAQSEYDGNPDSSVSQVQEALARAGYYHGAVDGSVGPATRNALRQYQRSHGLDVTGRVDRGVIEKRWV